MTHRVGEDLITGCGKCKQRTYHVIFAMEDTRIRRVQCKICLGYHNYHPDPEEAEEGATIASGALRRRDGDSQRVDGEKKPTRAKANAKNPDGTKAPRASRSRKDEPPDWSDTWTKALHGLDLTVQLEYRPTSGYNEGAVVHHPMFGVGLVTKVSPDRKIHVLFQDGPKLLVCNR